LNEKPEAAFPGSGFVVSDPALNEKTGFVVDKLVGANDDGLVAPPCACAPALGTPNSVVVFPVAPVVDCP
jgi:hypothetical protein